MRQKARLRPKATLKIKSEIRVLIVHRDPESSFFKNVRGVISTYKRICPWIYFIVKYRKKKDFIYPDRILREGTIWELERDLKYQNFEYYLCKQKNFRIGPRDLKI